MSGARLILAIDQGTTSTRAIAFDLALRPVASAARPLETVHPRAGWVEQDPDAILASVEDSVAEVLEAVGGPDRIGCVGLDNQGETVVAWDAETGRALAPAIGWQCRRSLSIVERLAAAGHGAAIRSLTGLPLDPYFSAGKMTWLLENHPPVAAAALDGTLRLGTVDAWLTARLGDGGPLTDPSTASRTQLFGLRSLAWEPELLSLFGVDASWLPVVRSTTGDLGVLAGRRLTALACDQQAALAGHGAFNVGAVKATYGTGVFVLANAGPRRDPAPGLEVSIAWRIGDEPAASALQGGVLTAGAMLDWLTDDLAIVASAAETEGLATAVTDSGGVRFLPALSGLGAPWYRPDARAVIGGLMLSTRREHLVRAALDGIAQRTCDIVEAVVDATGHAPPSLRVDGGLSANRWLMQRQADLLGIPVEVVLAAESTALGIAGLAGIGAGLLEPPSIAAANPVAALFEPNLSPGDRNRERATWRRFVEMSVGPG